MVLYKRTVSELLLHSTRQLSVSQLLIYTRTESSVSEHLHSTRQQRQSLEMDILQEQSQTLNSYILQDSRVSHWTPTFYRRTESVSEFLHSTRLWTPTFYRRIESVSELLHSTRQQSVYGDVHSTRIRVSLWTPIFYKTTESVSELLNSTRQPSHSELLHSRRQQNQYLNY